MSGKLEDIRIGVFVCHCGLNIAGVVNVKEVVEYARTLPNVVFAIDNRYTCSDPGQEEIKEAIKKYNLNRVVVAACSPRMHEFTFRRCVAEAGLNPYLFEMANIREHCSWAHPSHPKEATEKAKETVKMAVAKARLLAPLEPIKVPVTPTALVIGGGIAGINAALDLAEMGFKVYLLEKKESIGGRMAQLDKTFPTLDCSICMPGDEEIILEDGRIATLKDLYDKFTSKKGFNPHPPSTLSFEDYSLKISEVTSVQKIPSPQKIIEVKTSAGARIRFTGDHPVLVDSPNGPLWVKCASLRIGDRLYSLRKICVEERPAWIIDLLPEDFKIADVDLIKMIRSQLKNKFGSLRKAASELNIPYQRLLKDRWISIGKLKNICSCLGLSWNNIKEQIWTIKYRGVKEAVRLTSQKIDEKIMYLLGLLASNGYIKSDKIRLRNTNMALIDLFAQYYKEVFPSSKISINYVKSKNTPQKDAAILQAKNKILSNIAVNLGVKEKMDGIIGFNESLISAFLRGYFDGDGYVDFREHQRWFSGKITLSSGECYERAYRIHILLKRLGIVSKVHKYGERATVDISERRDLLLFARKVGSNHPEKSRRLDLLIKRCSENKCRGELFEEMPLECGKLLARIRDRYKIPLKAFPITRVNARNILTQKRRITRENLLKVLNSIENFVCPFDEDFSKLQKIAGSNIFLDRVDEILIVDPPSDGYVYDITVKGTHCFMPRGSFVVSNCIEGPKMVDVARHPNIQIISFADLVSVEGYVGNFAVRIRKNPRYVLEDKCTGCGECVAVCPIEYPNEWDMNLGVRKAISVPFPQAVPLVYRINRDYCIECFKCVDACGPRQAIDFEQKPEEIELKVGAIIVATGYDIYMPEEGNLYGYGKYSNVITSLEFERLILAAGPTSGHVVRASDGKRPKVVAFIQCVGSRDVDKYPYCSNFCCMYTLKHTIQLKEHYGDDVDVYVFYMDLRSHFKGYEEFYQRARDMGVNFIRGRVSRIEEDQETKNLIIYAEDTLLGEPITLEAEMVVLATAAVPSKGSEELARLLNIPRGTDGFLLESHPKLKPLDTPVDGIFLAGACQGPKDIPYSVAQGCGAAARAATILSKEHVTIEPIVAFVDADKCRNTKVKCGICAMKCPYGAITAELGMPAQVMPAKCHGCGTCVAECPADAITQMHFTDAQILAQIDAALENNPEDKILGICCNWCAYAGADLAGTSRFEYPTNIRIVRVMCSGRVDRDFVLYAFKKGAGMVLIGACHPYDCHYIDGNLKMRVRMDALAKALEKLGLTPDRLRVEYVSAAEGIKFAQIVREMTAKLKEIGRERIIAENEKIRPHLERMLSRKR